MPTEYRADLVVLLLEDGPVAGIVVEVQLGRDPDKLYNWPLYAAALRARLRCPVLLLVVCADQAIAEWCARPIEFGDGRSVFCPLVLGPSAVPMVTDVNHARKQVELAVLSAMSHAQSERAADVAWTAIQAIAEATQLDETQVLFYNDLVESALGEAARAALAELMSTAGYQYQSEFARKYHGQGLAEGKAEGLAEGLAEGKAEGLAEGKAEGIVEVLVARGLEVSGEARARIRNCQDLEQLRHWLRLALTVNTVDELFAE